MPSRIDGLGTGPRGRCMALVPRHLAEEDIAGICVRDGLISASRVTVSPAGEVHLRSVGWAEYDRGLSDDGLSSAIRHAWRQFRMPTRSVVGCLHSDSVQYRHFRFDNLGVEDLEPTLTLEAEELLKRSRADIVTDWHLTYPTNGKAPAAERSQRLEGVMVAVPRKEVDRLFYVLKHAGLYTVVLDIGPLAAANLFRDLRPAEREPGYICLLDLNPDSVDMVVLGQDGFAYPRSLRSYSAPWDEALDYLLENVLDVLRHVRFGLRRPPVERDLPDRARPGSGRDGIAIGNGPGAAGRGLEPPGGDQRTVAEPGPIRQRFGPRSARGFPLRWAWPCAGRRTKMFEINLIKDRVLPPRRRKALYWGLLGLPGAVRRLLVFVVYTDTHQMIAAVDNMHEATAIRKSVQEGPPGEKDMITFARTLEKGDPDDIEQVRAVEDLVDQSAHLTRILLGLTVPMSREIILDDFRLDRAAQKVAFKLSVPEEDARRRWTSLPSGTPPPI